MNVNLIVSPNALWRDFDCKLGDPETGVISQSDADGITVKKFYFSACACNDGKVRVYCEVKYTRSAKDKFDDQIPLVILAGDMNSPEIKETEEKLLSRDFAVLSYDFLGKNESAARFTIYPESLDFANYSSVEDIFSVKDNPKETCWYVWNAVTRHIITAVGKINELKELDSSRIAVLGIGLGGNIAYQLAATDERIKTAVVIGEYVAPGFGSFSEADSVQTGMFDEEHSKFIYSLSSQAHAKLVKKPVLVHLSTNEDDLGFQRGADTFSRLPSKLKLGLSVSPYTQHSVAYRQRDNIIGWLKYHVLNEGEFPDMPSVEIKSGGDDFCINLTADRSLDIKNIEVYYAYDTADGAIRNWHTVVIPDGAEGAALAKLELASCEQQLFAFGIVNYRNGISAASRLLTKAVKVQTSQKAANRIIYSAESGYDCFGITNPGSFFHKGKELSVLKGPLELKGITANLGNLATFKLGDRLYYGYDNDILQLNIYSAEPQTLTVVLHERTNGEWEREFSAKVTLTGGELWQKVSLSASDFKSRDGHSLVTWEDMPLLEFVKEKDFLLNGMIWA